MNKRAQPTPEFAIAQPVSPSPDLLAWLDALPADTVLRVPVEVQISVLGIGGAKVGFGANPLEVKVNDSALGESLADRAQGWCGDHATCAMWVWATWRDRTLRVTNAESAIAAADRAHATHLYIAK